MSDIHKKYPKSFLKKLYETMVRIRTCEESFVEPILNKEILCPVHLYTGQEAVATGVCTALEKTDYIFGTHRSHGHYLAKGGSMKKMVAEIYCRETGCARGRGGSMHIIDTQAGILGAVPIVGGTISLSLGAALASSMRNETRVTVSFFGDGAVGEGVLYESLNFASLYKLPIIFACENNYYSTHMPILECRLKNSMMGIGKSFRIDNYRVDGNNVLKVYDAAKKAVLQCRQGSGPVFLEFMTYRLRGHVGPDDNIQCTHTDIRSVTEIKKWEKRDPISHFRRYLIKHNILNEEELCEIQRNTDREVKAAHKFAKMSPRPDKKELGKYVFRE